MRKMIFSGLLVTVALANACTPESPASVANAEAGAGADTRTFWSPYQDLNWPEIGHYDSEFHTHPGLGGEQYDPHQTIDRYHEEGYKILTLAAHDYDVPDAIDSLYPWTQLADIYDTIKDIENPTEDNQTYAQLASEPYQNRDPIALGMVSVEGNEVSGPHHTVSVFNANTQGDATEAETFQRITDMGGMAYLAHPGRYVERWGLTAHWYVDKYLRFDVLIGQSIYNRRDNHPGDRAFYDRVQHLLGGINRPIWLYGEDDMHVENTLGWNRDVFLLEDFRPGSLHPSIPDGSAPDVMIALRNGYTYLWKPSEQYNRRAFNIINVRVNGADVALTIDNEELVEEVRWRTHNPAIDDTETVHTGFTISSSDVPAYALFVRAEIQGQDGTIYTQPFYLQ